MPRKPTNFRDRYPRFECDLLVTPPDPPERPWILVVDDGEGVGPILCRYIRAAACPRFVREGKQAIAATKRYPNVKGFVLDWQLVLRVEGERFITSGVDLLRELRRWHPDVPALITSDYDIGLDRETALQNDATSLPKRFDHAAYATRLHLFGLRAFGYPDILAAARYLETNGTITDRERKLVLGLAAHNRSDLPVVLGIKHPTIAAHTRSLRKKLGTPRGESVLAHLVSVVAGLRAIDGAATAAEPSTGTRRVVPDAAVEPGAGDGALEHIRSERAADR